MVFPPSPEGEGFHIHTKGETKTQPHVRMVPGLNDHIKNNVFNKSMSNNVFPERVMKYNTYFNLYSDLYFTLIQKITHYIDEYPQYMENRNNYNNLRLLLTVASLKVMHIFKFYSCLSFFLLLYFLYLIKI